MSLDLRQLRAFVAIAERGSLGRASTVINTSQPALSRLLQEMESRLGVALFDRSRSGMTLTSHGEALLPHARLLLFDMTQAIAALETLSGLQNRIVRIGAVATIARSILPGAVMKLLEKMPDVRIELMEAADDRLLASLIDKTVDLVIAGEILETPGVTAIAQCRFDDSYTAFCSIRHPIADGRPLSMERVLAEPWIMPPLGATPRTLFEAAVATAGHRMPRIAIETMSPSAIAAFVSRGFCLGWLPRPLIASEEAVGAVHALDVAELALPRRFFVYRRDHGILQPAALRLVEELPLLT
jgi:DNA-binding transcriptional LysR family regulator